jgi:hypothetical protein
MLWMLLLMLLLETPLPCIKFAFRHAPKLALLGGEARKSSQIKTNRIQVCSSCDHASVKIAIKAIWQQ